MPMLTPTLNDAPWWRIGRSRDAWIRIGQDPGPLDGRAGLHQHHEFIAAQPRDGVGATTAIGEPFGGFHQHGVARIVTGGVVYLLEAVEVDQQQADGVAGAFGHQECVVDLLLEQASVAQARQRIVQRQPLEFPLGTQQFLVLSLEGLPHLMDLRYVHDKDEVPGDLSRFELVGQVFEMRVPQTLTRIARRVLELTGHPFQRLGDVGLHGAIIVRPHDFRDGSAQYGIARPVEQLLVTRIDVSIATGGVDIADADRQLVRDQRGELRLVLRARER